MLLLFFILPKFFHIQLFEQRYKYRKEWMLNDLYECAMQLLVLNYLNLAFGDLSLDLPRVLSSSTEFPVSFDFFITKKLVATQSYFKNIIILKFSRFTYVLFS